MTALRGDLPPVPARMARLPVDKRGYPVPWFVHYENGEPDFRVIRVGGLVEAVNKSKCWLCGERLGRNAAFVIGPMCAVNRVSSEPPSHLECAVFAALACPFLTRPAAKRRDANMPENVPAPGNMICGNPGAVLVWVSRTWRPVRADRGYLIDVGEPVATSWYREGRKASRDEVCDVMRRGLPALLDIAEREGAASITSICRELSRALNTLVPAAA